MLFTLRLIPEGNHKIIHNNFLPCGVVHHGLTVIWPSVENMSCRSKIREAIEARSRAILLALRLHCSMKTQSIYVKNQSSLQSG